VKVTPPPFRLTPVIVNLCTQISERVGALSTLGEYAQSVRLRRLSRIRTIHGRMGRLWQTLILSHWRPLFAYIPVESLVHQNQSVYYAAIRESTRLADSEPLITFMLGMIRDALANIDPPHATPHVERLLSVLQSAD
jgi:hypothetical protein